MVQTWVVAVVVAGFALAGPSPASTSLVCAEQPSFDYDFAGRLIKAIDPLGNDTDYAYDLLGRQTRMTDPNNSTTTYAYDALGQLTAVTEGLVPLPAPAGSDVNVKTQFEYTPVGDVKKIIDPLGAVTAFTYDPLGRTLSETNPLGKVWAYQYDALGRLTKEIDAKNQTTNYQYTPRSDVALVDFATGADTTFQYDAAQNMVAMTDNLGASGWVFDGAGRMTEQTDSLGQVLGYEYDETGAQTAMQLPGGQTVTYEYDEAGRPILETSPWGSLAYGYDAASNLTGVLRTTGVTSEYEYDAANRVTSIQHTSPGSELGCSFDANDIEVGAGVDIEDLIDLDICLTIDIDVPVLTGLDYGDSIDLDYTYDAAGNVASQTRKDGSAAAIATSYTYDRLNRLTASTASNAVNNTYQYDKAGNRTKWVTNKAPDTGAALTVNATYNGAGQLLSEAKTRPGLLGIPSTVTTTLAYDNNGNRTSSQTGPATTTYKYTPDDKLAEVNQAGRKVTTGYDGLGRALTETVNSLLILSDTTQQVWDGRSVVQQDVGEVGETSLVRDVTGDVAIQNTEGLLLDDTRWGLTDRLGSTIAQTHGSKVGQLARYSDWGVPTFATLGWNSQTGYTGELGDSITGLNNYYARAYQPMSGSWLSADPYRGTMSDPGTLGRYAYVGGNPSTFADLYGFAAGKALGGLDKSPLRGYAGLVPKSGGPEVNAPGTDDSRGAARHGPTCGVIDKPVCARQHDGAELPYCEDTRLATMAWADCRIDFRPKTVTLKLLELALMLTPLGPVAKVLGKVLGPLIKALSKVTSKKPVPIPVMPPVVSPGTWTATSEAMSVRAAAYQAQITGATGQAYVVNGVKFDGFAAGALQEAKGPGYAAFVSNGEFQPWFSGADALVSQAQRQATAAGGTPVVWSVAEEQAALAIRDLVGDLVTVVYVPAK